MKVCYFGGYDPAYARNRVLIKGLRLAGADVVECVDRGHKALRLPRLAARFLARCRDADVIVVGASGHAYVPLARALATAVRIPLVFDAFVSMYETGLDRNRAGLPQAQARRLLRIDRRTAKMSDVVLLDTPEHAAWYASHTGEPATKFRSIAIGTDTDVFAPLPPRRDDGSFHVLFVGNFIPLQGIPVIIEAAAKLRHEKTIRFTLLGRGQTYAEARELAARLDAPVEFADPVPYASLPPLCGAADLLLGIFDAGEKAARVVPNKVYEALALARAVLTADTPSTRGLLTHGKDAYLVPPGDADALAKAIVELRDSPELRERIAQGGRATLLAKATPAILGRELLEICREVAR